MAHSKRKTPIFGNTTAPSEKHDKRLANRMFRRKTKIAVKNEVDPPQKIDEVFNMEWDGSKDGKHYWHNAQEKDMRK